MVTVTEYPRLLRRVLEPYAAIKPAMGQIESELIIDEARGHFEIIRTGWLNGNRVHGIVIHIDIINDKFWIQHDGTEVGIANELLESGVPKDHIVLAFQAPEMRQYTDFAVS